MTERQHASGPRRVLVGFAAVAVAPAAVAPAEEMSTAIAVQTAVLDTEPGMEGHTRSDVAPGTIVAFLDEQCTERGIEIATAEGWVPDLAVVPITGPNAAPPRICAVAQHLENRAGGSAVEAQQHRDQILTLDAVLLDYFPGTAFAAQAVERLQSSPWYTIALATPAG